MDDRTLALSVMFTVIASLAVATAIVTVDSDGDGEAPAQVIDSGTVGEGLAWQFDDRGVLTISGQGTLDEEGRDVPWSGYGNDIERVVFGEGVENIGADTLYCAKNLRSVSISSTVTSISYHDEDFDLYYGALDECNNLEEITVAPGNPRFEVRDGVLIDNETKTIVRCPPKMEIMSYTVPDDIKIIGQYAFSMCNALINLTIHDDVEAIGKRAFYGCISLVSADVPGGVTEVEPYAFAECWSLGTVVLQDGVEVLWGCAFLNCFNLESVEIPASMREMMKECFEGCSRLGSVTIPEGVEEIGARAFRNCSSLTSVDIPASVTSLGRGAFVGCFGIESFNIDENNADYKVVDGVVFSTDGKTLLYCIPTKEGAYVIPDGVETIGSYAFIGCSISSVTIPASVDDPRGSMWTSFAGCNNLSQIIILGEGEYNFGLGLYSEVPIDCTVYTDIEDPETKITGDVYYRDGDAPESSVNFTFRPLSEAPVTP